MKNSSDTIGNRNRSLPACRVVPYKNACQQFTYSILDYPECGSSSPILNVGRCLYTNIPDVLWQNPEKVSVYLDHTSCIYRTKECRTANCKPVAELKLVIRTKQHVTYDDRHCVCRVTKCAALP